MLQPSTGLYVHAVDEKSFLYRTAAQRPRTRRGIPPPLSAVHPVQGDFFIAPDVPLPRLQDTVSPLPEWGRGIFYDGISEDEWLSHGPLAAHGWKEGGPSSVVLDGLDAALPIDVADDSIDGFDSDQTPPVDEQLCIKAHEKLDAGTNLGATADRSAAAWRIRARGAAIRLMFMSTPHRKVECAMLCDGDG